MISKPTKVDFYTKDDKKVSFKAIRTGTKTKMKKAKTKVVKKGWAVCFALSKKCMQGDLAFFTRKSYARRYIKILHKEIGGLEDDHHIVPCTISYTIPKKPK